MKKYVVLAAGIALAASTGAAQASQQGYYISGELGASLMPDQTFRSYTGPTTNSSFNAGYAFGGAAGYDSGDGWRVELNSLYQNSALDRTNGSLNSGHLQSTSVMVNGTYDILKDTQITPYVGGGLGWQDIGATINGHHGDDEWEPAYQLEAGLRDDLNDRFSIFAEYRYTQAEAARLSNPIDMGNQHYSDHLMLTGITYHLGDDFLNF